MMIAIVDTVKTAKKRPMMKGGAKIGEKGKFFIKYDSKDWRFES